MSTKIYDAYRLPSGADPLSHLAEIREIIIRTKVRADLAEAVRLTVDALDRYTLSGDTLSGFDPEFPLVSTLTDRQEEFSDNDCKVAFLRDSEDGRHHTILLTSCNDHRETLGSYFDAHGWTDYHYQNQSDGPEDVSEEDWEERRRAWDRMIGYGPLSQYAAIFAPAGGSLSSVIPFVRENGEVIASTLADLHEGRLRRMLMRNPSRELNDSQEAMDWLFSVLDLVTAAEEAGDQTLARAQARMRPMTPDDLYGAPVTPVHDLTPGDLSDLYECLSATYEG